jgi:hypothetical protein
MSLQDLFGLFAQFCVGYTVADWFFIAVKWWLDRRAVREFEHILEAHDRAQAVERDTYWRKREILEKTGDPEEI